MVVFLATLAIAMPIQVGVGQRPPLEKRKPVSIDSLTPTMRSQLTLVPHKVLIVPVIVTQPGFGDKSWSELGITGRVGNPKSDLEHAGNQWLEYTFLKDNRWSADGKPSFIGLPTIDTSKESVKIARDLAESFRTKKSNDHVGLLANAAKRAGCEFATFVQVDQATMGRGASGDYWTAEGRFWLISTDGRSYSNGQRFRGRSEPLNWVPSLAWTTFEMALQPVVDVAIKRLRKDRNWPME